MTCAHTSELLAAYADGGLEGREHDEVAAHVRGCSACTDEVRVLRKLLADTRHLGAAPPSRSGSQLGSRSQKDEAFWNDLARDIRVAIADEKPAARWWRLPAVTAAFALAAAALPPAQPARSTATAAATATALAPASTGTGTGTAPTATPLAIDPPARVAAGKPLPMTYSAVDLEDLEGAQLAAVSAALSADDEPSLSEGELAVASPAVAEAYLENLDESDLARVDTAL